MQILSKYILLILIFGVSCAEAEKPPYELPKNAEALIAGDSFKTWKLARRFNKQYRMNMGDCFLSYKQTYNSDMTMHDNNGEHRDCGETLHAKWELTKDEKGHSYIKWVSEQLPSLMNIEEDYKNFKIINLSNEEMTVQFKHKQFSNKTTTMTDFMCLSMCQLRTEIFIGKENRIVALLASFHKYCNQ